MASLSVARLLLGKVLEKGDGIAAENKLATAEEDCSQSGFLRIAQRFVGEPKPTAKLGHANDFVGADRTAGTRRGFGGAFHSWPPSCFRKMASKSSEKT
jgi:hypothetical protein